ncbi:MAG: ribosome small subunit-dependent GTPase A [Chloroflexi bacterium]|nr:ribosome small subunit-dependent GTPase A [Chloroflexota bacterium]
MNTDHEYDQGVVFRKMLGHYTVHAGGREFVCVLSSRLRKQLIYPIADPTSLAHIVREVRPIEGVDPVAVGDAVIFFETGNGSGMITEVLPRRAKLSRPATMPGARVFEQVIVANADQVVPVFSAASPPPKWPLLDRYLVSAEASRLSSLICITKLDLARPESGLEEALAIYRGIGYEVRCVSALTGEGLDELKESLRGRVSVFVGKSGVGKTTLLNAIQPGLGLQVRTVGQGKLGKGRHTTTHLEMFPLDFDGAVVDTPGMREFGLWDVGQDDLALFFPEMRPLVGRCKFGLDCRHDSEPGCVIRKAVMDGAISPLRYQSFMRLQEEG